MVAVSGEATTFADEVRGALLRRDGSPAFFAHQALRLAVDNIAAAEQTEPEALHASATLIDVRGPWWVLLRPGELLCSVDTALSSDRAAEALALAFRRQPADEAASRSGAPWSARGSRRVRAGHRKHLPAGLIAGGLTVGVWRRQMWAPRSGWSCLP